MYEGFFLYNSYRNHFRYTRTHNSKRQNNTGNNKCIYIETQKWDNISHTSVLSQALYQLVN